MVDFILKEIKKFPTHGVSEGLVDFAQRVRVLDSGNAARPGPYKYSAAPYLRAIADCMSDNSRITETVFMKGTQEGGTDGILINDIAYDIYYGIGPILYVTSDDDLALEFMQKRIDPMIQASGLQEKIIPPVQKKGNHSKGDTLRSKSFGGTYLRSIGARSESKLSSFPVRKLLIDEIDKYLNSLSGGGNPVEKAIRRTDSYRNLKKICYISTPKMRSTSQIEPLFKQGTAEYYYFQCPKCGTYQILEWNRIKWDKNEDGKILLEYDKDNALINNPVWLECENKECSHKIMDYEKVNFLKEKRYGGTAEWRATKKPDRPNIRSFHANALYGFRTWLDIVLQWDKIDDDPVLLQDFVNDVLGETYTDDISKPNEHYLASRAEPDFKRGDISEGVKTLFSGTDVQGNRLETSLVGFGPRKETWIIDHIIHYGDTNDPNSECYDELEELLRKKYTKKDGSSIMLQTAFIDAPYANPAVLKFCSRFNYRARTWQNVYPIFGKGSVSTIVKSFKSPIPQPYIDIDDQKLKHEIYYALDRKKPAEGLKFPYGYIHFPTGFDDEYFKQLVAEDIITVEKKHGVIETVIANPHQRRNEPLDTLKMSIGALYWMYLEYFRILNEHNKKHRKPEQPTDWRYFWNLFGMAEEEAE